MLGAGLEDGGRAMNTQNASCLLKLENGRKQILLSSPEEECSPEDTNVMGRDAFQTSDLQNCKMNLCYYNPLYLRYLLRQP